MRSPDFSLRRYRQLNQTNPGLFENSPGCPTRILLESEAMRRAQNDAEAERHAAGWQTDDLRIGVLAEDPYIGYVIRDAVEFFDGRLGLYNRIVASGGVVILPILEDGSIALIRIFRHPPRRWFFEAPQGLVLPGQDPATVAKDELIEEIGAIVGEITPLGILYTSTALTSENLKMFAAKITTVGSPQRSEGIESISKISKADIDRLVLDGTICDGPTISLILHARIRGLL